VGLIFGLISKAGLIGLALKGAFSGVFSGTAGHFVSKWWKRHDQDDVDKQKADKD
jgi:hypothetical protein